MSLAKLISDTQVANEIREALKQQVCKWKSVLPTFAPGLRIVQVGAREDSNVYIRMKIKAATEIGIDVRLVQLPRSITQIELLDKIFNLNNDPSVHGIIVQMPLDCETKIGSHKITDAVSPDKDVDGLHTINEGRVSIGDLGGFMPCTPWGCIELIKRSGVKMEGANAVVLGRSKIVGTPAANLLKWYNATVTVCHSKTKNIADICRAADILVVGIGVPEMVKGSWIKPGAVVIDCGINVKPGKRVRMERKCKECSNESGKGKVIIRKIIFCIFYPTYYIQHLTYYIIYILQVIPMEDFNLHLTGDIHAVTAANNLLAAQLDTRIFHESTQEDKPLYERLVPKIKGERKFSKIQFRRLQRLGINKTDPDSLANEEITRFARLDIDPDTIMWERVVDVNDRYLRQITVGQSPTEKALSRPASFSISVASEIMAVLALASDLEDMKQRLGRMVVAFSRVGEPVTADDLGVTGALTVLLKDALEPNLMQTLEGTPVLVYAGPFANIAHGCSSIVADEIALKLVGKEGFVCTEAGFGSDIGMEKFCNIKCRSSGRYPNAMVLVATVRALKMHGGGAPVTPGAPLNKQYTEENLQLLEKGIPNLLQHISNGHNFGMPVVVAINGFSSDTNAEHEMIRKASLNAGAVDAVICTHWSEGGAGCLDLANAVIKACEKSNNFKLLYPSEMPLLDKLNTIAQNMYGAAKVELTPHAEKSMQKLTKVKVIIMRSLRMPPSWWCIPLSSFASYHMRETTTQLLFFGKSSKYIPLRTFETVLGFFCSQSAKSTFANIEIRFTKKIIKKKINLNFLNIFLNELKFK
ncbi:C-1-tetrahydrofolate synthase, cytoplasmic-like [Glossina fuscipes fuscipes]